MLLVYLNQREKISLQEKQSPLSVSCNCFQNKKNQTVQCIGGPSSSWEMIILRNNSHGGITRVYVGIFTTAPRNKKIRQILKKKNTSCYLTACFDEKNAFQRVVYFEVFNVLGFSGQLAKMRSFHQSKRSDNKKYAVEVR